MEVVKRKRGRPKGSKNKTKITKTKVIKGMEPDKDYLYYFVADIVTGKRFPSHGRTVHSRWDRCINRDSKTSNEQR